MSQSKKKIVVLCHGAFNYIKNKTGNMLIRYRTDEVVAILDNSKVGITSEDELGYGGDIPVLNNFEAVANLASSLSITGSFTTPCIKNRRVKNRIK